MPPNPDKPTPTVRRASSLGWAVSFLIHAVLVVLLMRVWCPAGADPLLRRGPRADRALRQVVTARRAVLAVEVDDLQVELVPRLLHRVDPARAPGRDVGGGRTLDPQGGL